MLGSGTNGSVDTILRLPNDDLIVGGRFTFAGGVSANCIARWDGTSWSPLGIGMDSGINAAIAALARRPDGDIIAAGFFGTAGGVPASHIAQWDGSAWAPLGSGMNQSVLALCTLPNGDIVAGGDFTIAGGVSANRVARWDGTTWSALGSGMNSRVQALAALPNGYVIAGGVFSTAGGVAAMKLARWDGTAWTSLDSGMTSNDTVRALLSVADGDVVVGGTFQTPGRAYVARLSTTCPAGATSHGVGCASSVGPLVLSADALPWVGATYRSVCTSIAPQGALAVGLLGATDPALPLSTLHPAAGPGCSLLASLDVVLFLPQNNGTAAMDFAIPADVSLVGVALKQQALQFELDTQFNILLLIGSNGLTLTVGAF
jgi:hypothetical protein